MTILDGFVRGRSAATRSIYVVTLCSMLFACGGGGSGVVDGSGGSGSGGGSTPATSLSCDGYPITTQTSTQVCLILREYAQVTFGVSVSTAVGNLAGHGFDILNAYVVYARIIATAADQSSATALATSVVVNTANSMISATPDQASEPEALQIDFEIFTATNTNLTLTSGTGNISVNNYNSILNLTSDTGNASLTTVQGQATVNVGTGNIDAMLSGSGWTGAGMNATTQSGNITVSRPAAYQAAFAAKSGLGTASIDGQKQTTAPPQASPAVVTAGSGAPIMLESKVGDVSVTAAQ